MITKLNAFLTSRKKKKNNQQGRRECQTSTPEDTRIAGKSAYRSLIVDRDAMEFSDRLANLHTKSDEEIIAGNGFTLQETRKLIALGMV